jgi:ABC-type branched-subunit amino acid transport system substrate-binding protein
LLPHGGGRLRGIGIRATLIALAGSAAMIGVTGSAPVQTGCADKAPPPSAQPPILFGASLGLTNGLAGTASALRDALRTAEGQINASGGLLGRPVQFEIVDDASDEGDVVKAKAQELVDKGVVAVVGPISSGQVLAVQDIFHQAHVIQMLPTATSTKITDIQPVNDRWLFRTTPADDFQGAAVMLLAQRTPRGLDDAGAPTVDGGADGGVIATCKKLALAHVDNAYGVAMGDVIEKNWPQLVGQPIISRQKVPVDLKSNYTDEVNNIYTAAAGLPECVGFIMYEDVGAEFIREFKADKRYPTLPNGFFFIGTDGVFDDAFIKLSRANQADETGANVLTDPPPNVDGVSPDSQPGTPEYNQFKTIFSSYFPLAGKDAPPFASNTYDAAILVALAVAKAGTVDDRVAVRDALLVVANPPGKTYTPGQYIDALQALQQGLDIDYKGASGDVDIAPNGNVKSGFAVWEAYRTTPDKKVDYKTIGRFDLGSLNLQLK